MISNSGTAAAKKPNRGSKPIRLSSSLIALSHNGGAKLRRPLKPRYATRLLSPSAARFRKPPSSIRMFLKPEHMQRELSYVEAVREATDQEMARDPSVIVFGLDVDDPKAIQGTTRGLLEKYGSERVFGTPLSEDAMTGVAIGAALAGLRPVHVHIRMDFLMLAMNQLINVAAKSRYMYGGQLHVPIVVRSMIGKSWGQGAQHSQGLYSLFMHVPGLKVVAPATPYDAKGCLIEAIRDDNPVLYVEHRLLHFQHGPVPEGRYAVKPGKARVTAMGEDI